MDPVCGPYKRGTLSFYPATGVCILHKDDRAPDIFDNSYGSRVWVYFENGKVAEIAIRTDSYVIATLRG